MRPSCEALRFPPGKTCAEGKEEDDCTLCNRRISFEGEMRRILDSVRCVVDEGVKGNYEELGLGSAVSFLGFEPEDMYCFSKSGRGVFAMARGRPLQDEATDGGFRVEYCELARDMKTIYIRLERKAGLPPVHCLKGMQLSSLRCIGKHLRGCRVAVVITVLEGGLRG
jgi:hypothetical protein